MEQQMNIYDYGVLNKKDLLSKYQNIIDVQGLDNIKCLKLSILMPTGETEVIINPNIVDKIKYIDETYDDNLIHINGIIKIIDYCFINKDQVVVY